MANTSIRLFDQNRLHAKFGGSVMAACQNWLGLKVSARPIPGVTTQYGSDGRPSGLTAYRRGHGRRSKPQSWKQKMLTEEEYNLVLAIQEVIAAKHHRLPSIPVVLGVISRLAAGAREIVIPAALTREQQREELLKNCYDGPIPMLTPRGDGWELSVECATKLNDWCKDNCPELFEENVVFVKEMPK